MTQGKVGQRGESRLECGAWGFFLVLPTGYIAPGKPFPLLVHRTKRITRNDPVQPGTDYTG